MNRLDRYLVATVMAGALAGLFVIVSLSFVFEFIDKADEIGRAGQDVASVMLRVALSMVQRAYEAFPMATLIGALVSLGALAARSELIAMRAVGLSVGRIAQAVVAAGVLLALIAAALGEYVAPPANRLAQSIELGTQGQSLGASRGTVWARDGDYLLRAERVVAADLLTGVRAYELANGALARIIHADQAVFDDGQWQLARATVTTFGPAQVTVDTVDSMRLGGGLQPSALEVVVEQASGLAARELWRYVGYLEQNNLDSDRYQLALWVKFATPFATIVMLLLTVPLVMGSQRSTGTGQRIFAGVLIGLAFFLLNRFLGNAGLVYGLPAPVSAFAPTLLFLAIALLSLHRVR